MLKSSVNYLELAIYGIVSIAATYAVETTSIHCNYCYVQELVAYIYISWNYSCTRKMHHDYARKTTILFWQAETETSLAYYAKAM